MLCLLHQPPPNFTLCIKIIYILEERDKPEVFLTFLRLSNQNQVNIHPRKVKIRENDYNFFSVLLIIANSDSGIAEYLYVIN